MHFSLLGLVASAAVVSAAPVLNQQLDLHTAGAIDSNIENTHPLARPDQVAATRPSLASLLTATATSRKNESRAGIKPGDNTGSYLPPNEKLIKIGTAFMPCDQGVLVGSGPVVSGKAA
ncbi:hypothetical protein BDR22DRAFT_566835 [Usnea florida]